MKSYKWTLRQGSKKDICPSCGKKRFVRYVLSTDNRVEAGDLYGRCDREQECKYHRYPNSQSYQADEQIMKPEPIKPISYIDNNLMERTLNYFDMQTLYNYFKSFTDPSELWERYKVGTSRNGASIFWQIDKNGNVRTGKIMQYLPNGKRNKADFGTWVHKLTDNDFNLQQCFFGEHLVKGGERIGIVESEKTALYLSIVEPGILWLASGGLHNLQSYRFRRLRNCDITLYPDKGCYHIWREKTNARYKIDTLLENTDLPDGVDLMDYYLLTK